MPETPFREEQGRLELENFYYAQEDEVFAAAERDGFTWSVHRPHTVIGKAVGNAMNMGTTLAVYASICQETGRPFRWPGSAAQWNGLSDITDARHVRPTSDMGSGNRGCPQSGVQRCQWRPIPLEMAVARIAEWFAVEPAASTAPPSAGKQMADDADVWRGSPSSMASPCPSSIVSLRPGIPIRSRPPDRGGDRYGQEPQGRLRRLSAD